MKLKIISVALLVFITGVANAQNALKGTVEETGSNLKLSNVFIKDVTNKQLTLTDKNGNFEIKSAPSHLLIFTSPGYISDTLYVVDMNPKHVKMQIMNIALREVKINGTRTAFDPKEEYPEVYQKSKVYILSPTTWFGKDSRDARHLRRYFTMEQQEEEIDKVFNTAYVSSLVPLRGQDLEDFMTLYRPSYSFVHNNNTQTMAVYINDSYKKFKALPANKRKLDRLSTDN
ncbi:peptidase associated/transthyretin-like domain-containing protein [Mucilaginibacter sp.]